jgi:hypothetical protein
LHAPKKSRDAAGIICLINPTFVYDKKKFSIAVTLNRVKQIWIDHIRFKDEKNKVT